MLLLLALPLLAVVVVVVQLALLLVVSSAVHQWQKRKLVDTAMKPSPKGGCMPCVQSNVCLGYAPQGMPHHSSAECATLPSCTLQGVLLLRLLLPVVVTVVQVPLPAVTVACWWSQHIKTTGICCSFPLQSGSLLVPVLLHSSQGKIA